jgi:hypothetical protein
VVKGWLSAASKRVQTQGIKRVQTQVQAISSNKILGKYEVVPQGMVDTK